MKVVKFKRRAKEMLNRLSDFVSDSFSGDDYKIILLNDYYSKLTLDIRHRNLPSLICHSFDIDTENRAAMLRRDDNCYYIIVKDINFLP